MNELSKQIQELLPKEKQFLHEIYVKVIKDYSYLWEEYPNVDKLRNILILIVRLFIEEHKNLHDINQLDQEKFKKVFRELISNPDALLQKTRKSQIKEIEGLGIEDWFKRFWKDIMTINKIVEKYEKLSPSEKFRNMLESIVYEGLSWQKPRKTIDFLTAYIQRGLQTTSPPEYIGLLNKEEKAEFRKNKVNAERSWQKTSTPQDRILSLIENRWKKYSQEAKARISGTVFFSDVMTNSENRRRYSEEENKARISFSLNLAKIDNFFDYMMTQLTKGVLSEIPIEFKIDDIAPQNQGNGENAHLYFLAKNEEKIYRILTEVIYPTLEKNELNALGGRFLMMPVYDKSGMALKGIEFGQGIYKSKNMPLEKREEIVRKNRGELATSQVMGEFLSFMYFQPIFRNKLERFRQIYQEGGKKSLLYDREFNQLYSIMRHHLIELGRDSDYPILDRDARKIFPNFTKMIL